MHTLAMPLDDAILASKALLHHVSNDDMTPVIMHAAVQEHDGKRYLVATDRYSFGRFMLGAFDIFEGDPGQLIPRDALTWVSKIIPKGLRRPWSTGVSPEDGGYSIKFTWTPVPGDHLPSNPRHELEVAIIFEEKPERSQTYDVPSGNFPPVVRLWNESAEFAIPALALSHGSLTKAAADLALFEGKNSQSAVRFTFTGSSSIKPGPVQCQMGPGGRWTAALQPSLLLR